MLKIDESNFLKEIIEYPNYALLIFFAKWCNPCKNYHKILEEKEIKDKAKIGYIDISNNEENELLNYFKIKSVPTTIIFKNGKKLNQFSGLKSKEHLLDLLI